MSDVVSPVATPLLAAALPDAVGGALVLAGSVVLVLALVALAAFAYKNLRGDGVEWPEDREPSDDELSRGGDDDEWKYY